ncbi:MAG: DUF739 domain-containing protein [Clostridia bacterium]|nr:DUF739 domain-containing protein [Clostridia bacterium]
MINVNELKAQMVRKQFTQESLAKEIGISSRTLHNKLKCGVFGSDEIEKMILVLDIKDPMSIFFVS